MEQRHQSQLELCSRGRKSPEKSLGRRDNRSVATFVKNQHLGVRGLIEYGLCVIEPALLFTSEGAKTGCSQRKESNFFFFSRFFLRGVSLIKMWLQSLNSRNQTQSLFGPQTKNHIRWIMIYKEKSSLFLA